MTGWHLFRGESYKLHSAVVLAVLALWAGRLATVQTNGAFGAAGHEVITLTNISPERGKEFLSRLKIATASKMPGTNALLVTGESSEVQKATVLLNLVDTRTEFAVKELGPAVTGQVPSSADITAAATGVSVGTFAHPPQDKNKTRVIVDVHQGTIVAVAPVFQMQDIQHAVDLTAQILKHQKALTATKETPGTKPPESGAPTVSGPVSGLEVATADAAQTIPAPAMLGASFTAKTTGGNSDVAPTPAKNSQKSSVESPLPGVGQPKASVSASKLAAGPKMEPNVADGVRGETRGGGTRQLAADRQQARRRADQRQA